jgi:hypothetical protein
MSSDDEVLILCVLLRPALVLCHGDAETIPLEAPKSFLFLVVHPPAPQAGG